jgi:pilus assembly protein Flp/PilA
MRLKRLRQALVRFYRRDGQNGMLRDKSGVTSVEYGMIALIIILGIVVGSSKIGNQLSYTFNNVSSEL